MNQEKTANPLVYLILLNWNGWQDTLRCLASVDRLEYPNYKVIVVDNCSTDDSVVRIRAARPDILMIQTEKNLGYGGGNNVALEYAFRNDSGAYALVLNNDLSVPPDFLSRAMESVLDGPTKGAAVVGFPAYLHEDPDRVDCAYLEDSFTRGPRRVTELPQTGNRVVEAVMVHGAAMLITPHTPVKLLPEDYFLYYEDADFCKQVRQQRGRVVVQLDNPVYHSPSRTIGAGSSTQIYYTRRSKLAYCRKYNSTVEYSIVLARMTYSALRGWLKSLFRKEGKHARAYRLSLWHHLRGKKGREWV